MDATYDDIAKMIDHSLLSPGLGADALEAGCLLAVKYNVASTCVMPYYLKRCAQILSGSTVNASTTIGFPHGANTTAVKLAEAERALADGGEELDMVVNISKVISEDWDYVRRELAAVIDLVHAAGQKVKVIFENHYLSDVHKIRLCELCGQLKADWAKTSTGFAPTGTVVADLELMRRHCPDHVQVKAAGGVRDVDTVLALRALGVSRVGVSRTKEILDEWRGRLA